MSPLNLFFNLMLLCFLSLQCITTAICCTTLISLLFTSASPWDHVREITCQLHYRAMKLDCWSHTPLILSSWRRYFPDHSFKMTVSEPLFIIFCYSFEGLFHPNNILFEKLRVLKTYSIQELLCIAIHPFLQRYKSRISYLFLWMYSGYLHVKSALRDKQETPFMIFSDN